MRKFCSNRAEVNIKDVDHSLQSIACIHRIVVVGNYRNEIHNIVLIMNGDVIGLPDLGDLKLRVSKFIPGD